MDLNLLWHLTANRACAQCRLELDETEQPEMRTAACHHLVHLHAHGPCTQLFLGMLQVGQQAQCLPCRYGPPNNPDHPYPIVAQMANDVEDNLAVVQQMAQLILQAVHAQAPQGVHGALAEMSCASPRL